MPFAKKQEVTTYIALQSFVGRLDGRQVQVTKDKVYDANDPLVKAFPTMFAPQEYQRFAAPAVEQATAAPGEKRS